MPYTTYPSHLVGPTPSLRYYNRIRCFWLSCHRTVGRCQCETFVCFVTLVSPRELFSFSFPFFLFWGERVTSSQRVVRMCGCGCGLDCMELGLFPGVWHGFPGGSMWGVGGVGIPRAGGGGLVLLGWVRRCYRAVRGVGWVLSFTGY